MGSCHLSRTPQPVYNTEKPHYNDSIFLQDYAVKKNFRYKEFAALKNHNMTTSMINDKKLTFPYLTQETYVVDIC